MKRIWWKDYNKYWCTTRRLPEPNFIHIIPSRCPKTERSTITEHNYSKIPMKSEDLLKGHLNDHTYNLPKENWLLIDQQYADDTVWVAVNAKHRTETRSHMAYGTAERMFLHFFEGMMTLFHLVGNCALGWCTFVFKLFFTML